MFSEQVRNVHQVVQPEHMQAKTNQIRSTLKTHYLKQTQLFREQVASSVWTIVIDEMLQLEHALLDRLKGKCRTPLEGVVEVGVCREFSVERGRVEARAKRFRTAIDEINEATEKMRSALQIPGPANDSE